VVLLFGRSPSSKEHVSMKLKSNNEMRLRLLQNRLEGSFKLLPSSVESPDPHHQPPRLRGRALRYAVQYGRLSGVPRSGTSD
jgi:hypothetical protein